MDLEKKQQNEEYEGNKKTVRFEHTPEGLLIHLPTHSDYISDEYSERLKMSINAELQEKGNQINFSQELWDRIDEERARQGLRRFRDGWHCHIGPYQLKKTE